MLLIEKYFFWFILYSLLGWIYEVIICSIKAKKFINRGFLNGPYCPIYGAGAILNILALNKVNNIFLVFILGTCLNCSLEYITSYLLEKIFHARWWDYSNRKFNIKGRICLLGAIVFGIFSVLLKLYIHPFIITLTSLIPNFLFHSLTILFFIIFIIDCTITLKGILGLNKLLEELANNIEKANKNIKNQVKSSVKTAKSIYESFNKRITRQQHRILSNFPNFKSIPYHQLLEKLKSMIIKEK